MSSLKEHQEAFLKLVATPKEMTQVLKENPSLNHQIAESERFPAARRIKIYSTAYYLRIVETMKDNYPKTLEALGLEAFEILIGDYILAHPSTHYSLSKVDQHFVDFIEDPEIANIALFEQKELECFFSRDSESLTLEELQQIPQDQWIELNLVLIPSCILVEFDREIDKHTLFFRPALDVHYRNIDETQAALIEQLKSSSSFTALCEKAAELSSPEEAINLVGSHLLTWIHDGIIERFPVNPREI